MDLIGACDHLRNVYGDRVVFESLDWSYRLHEVLTCAEHVGRVLGESTPADATIGVVVDETVIGLVFLIANAAEARRLVLMPAHWSDEAVWNAADITSCDAVVLAGERAVPRDFAVSQSIPSPVRPMSLVLRSRAAISDPQRSLADVVVFTSGTTGVPRPVLHDYRSLVCGYALLRALRLGLLGSVVDTYELSPSSLGDDATGGFSLTNMSLQPPASIAGIVLGLQALLAVERHVSATGATQPRDIAERVKRFGVTSLALPPFLGERIARLDKGVIASRFDSLFVLGLGGGSCPAPVARRIEERLGCRIVNGYGCTEAAGPIMTTRFDAPDESRWTSIGEPLPFVEAKLSEEGELLVRSPSLAVGYLGAGGAVQPLMMEDDWFRTRDRAYVDRDGWHYAGRLDQSIMRGGNRIDPNELAAALETHPLVVRAAVKGMPSRIAGEEDVVATVERTSELLTRAMLIEHIVTKYPELPAPQRIRWDSQELAAS